MLLKCCAQYVSKFGKLSSGHWTGKYQFSFQPQKMAMPKNVQTATQLHSFHMQASFCSNSFKLGFSKCFPGVGNGKEPTCQHKRHKRSQVDSWVEKSPGVGNGNPLQYSCLDNPHGQRILATVHGVTKSWT